jgi:hypothetical protein
MLPPKIKTITELSLKPHKTWLPVFIGAWIGIIPNLPKYSPLEAFLTPLWYVTILLILPFIAILIYIPLFYWKIFKKVTIINKKYFVDLMGTNNFIEFPELILNEDFVSRFSFKLKFYGDISSKRLVLLIKKAPTVNIYLKQHNEKLNQESENITKDLFYIKQDYELFSSSLSYSIYIETAKAEDTTRLEMYLEDEEFLNKIRINPNLKPKNLIHSENFYLSK